MVSYNDHRLLTLRIRELADALVAETDALHATAAARSDPTRAANALESSTDWLHQASHALLLVTAALRTAREELSGVED